MCAHFSGRGMEGGRGTTWANFEESAQKSGVYLMFVLCLTWCICSSTFVFCSVCTCTYRGHDLTLNYAHHNSYLIITVVPYHPYNWTIESL